MKSNSASLAPSRPVPDTRHPCVGCDIELTRTACAGFIVGPLTGRIGPLCRSCFQRCKDSTVFADQVEGAVDVGHTLPAVRVLFARAGLPVPTTPTERAHAAAVLALRKAAR